jgi:hypothetical protein
MVIATMSQPMLCDYLNFYIINGSIPLKKFTIQETLALVFIIEYHNQITRRVITNVV